MAPPVSQAAAAEASGGPLDIWRVIFTHSWLLGALLAVLGAVLESIGLILQKKGQYKLMGDNLGPNDPKPTRRQLLTSHYFWIGLTLYLLYSPANMLALNYAPETTVMPVSAFVVVLNAFLAFSVLYERFTRTDLTASVVCIVGAIVMNIAMSQTIPGHLEDFPIDEVVKLSGDIFGNTGFAAYLVVWLALLIGCLYVIYFVSMQNMAKPFAVPLLVGLFRAMFHFTSKIMVTLVSRAPSEPAIWSNPATTKAMVTTFVLYFFTVFAMCEGIQQLSARFFVPAMFVACQVLTVTQDLLFFRAWESMTNTDIVIFVIASAVSLTGVAFISAEQRVISSPDASGLNTPLLSPKTDAIRLHQSILAIMDEYKIRKPTSPEPGPLELVDMSVPISGRWRLFPICVCFGFVLTPTGLWAFGEPFKAMVVLTVFSMYQGWKLGMHMALFAYVGIKKMAHFENADFQALYQAEIKEPKWKRCGGPKWEDIKHFVCLPNYKEDIGVLRLAIKSIADSAIAKQQICLVMAMEAREDGAKEKAEGLIKEFRSSFWACEATYHPAGLPGETPGKSANTRWAAQKILDEVIPARKLDINNVIFTVGDADSEFHSEYFAALTYYFVHAGGEKGEAPDRFLTIWQPPILHFKNFVTQPAVVRLASLVTSEHELANLADPNATRVPYSTYSISAVLAAGVNGWDPDWISEDWHMALKCFMATGGRLKISPIFLPILNYAPEGESMFQTIVARWIQAKRHALGFSELVYMSDHMPRVVRALQTKKERTVVMWRAFFLWIKLLMIHLFMAAFLVIAPMNAILIAYFANHEIAAALSINSWTFLVNCVFQGIGILSFFGLFLVSVLVFNAVKNRIDGSQEANIFWQYRILHFITEVPMCLACFPLFFAFGGAAEWIAAVKSSKTHVFDYAVALKPKLAE